MDLLRSLPLGLYLEEPVTWLHRLDPRVKLAWLTSFLAAPILASPLWRTAMVGLLIVLTLSAMIPLRVWRRQMGWLLLLSGFILALTVVTPDGLAIQTQPRLPTLALESTFAATDTATDTATDVDADDQPEAAAEPPPALAQPTPYRYILFKQEPITISQRSLELGIRVSTLIFTLIYGTNLFLLTTASEEITAALEELLQPLRWFKWPVTEIALTVTLALRFIPLVLEEVQNLVRSVRTRAINWRKLGFRRAAQIWVMVAERLLENLLLRAEQTAAAMQVRGFTSPDEHRVVWRPLRLRRWDWLACGVLVLFWGMRIAWGGDI
ncbi:MAG: CbiQ family ECF transporter T component [Leptolyngbyaceae cyanobacterium MO_188.B28]|nr:CbiQ family ECF transporter T component [Leptolyngbyaceae cyanobacterium MO_188.B28]